MTSSISNNNNAGKLRILLLVLIVVAGIFLVELASSNTRSATKTTATTSVTNSEQIDQEQEEPSSPTTQNKKQSQQQDQQQEIQKQREDEKKMKTLFDQVESIRKQSEWQAEHIADAKREDTHHHHHHHHHDHHFFDAKDHKALLEKRETEIALASRTIGDLHLPSSSSAYATSFSSSAFSTDSSSASSSAFPKNIVSVEDSLRIMQMSGLQVNDTSTIVSNSPIFEIFRIPVQAIGRTVLKPVSKRISSTLNQEGEEEVEEEVQDGAVRSKLKGGDSEEDDNFFEGPKTAQDLLKRQQQLEAKLKRKNKNADSSSMTSTSHPSSSSSSSSSSYSFFFKAPIPKIQRPKRSNMKVAFCFFGLIRYHKMLERTYDRAKRNLQHFEHDIFVSTWNYFQSGASLNKLARGRNATWFANGEQREDIPEMLRSAYGKKLKGYFIGDHKQVRFCRHASCIVAMVRSNCMHAISAHENRIDSHYPIFFVTKIDRAIEFPVWFTPGCPLKWPKNPFYNNYDPKSFYFQKLSSSSSSSSSSSDPSSAASRNQERQRRANLTCYLRIGNCTSYYRTAFFVPFAKLDSTSFATHMYLNRWHKTYDRIDRRFVLVSDYSIVGFRDAVSSLLLRAFKISEEGPHYTFSAELLIAVAVAKLRFDVYPINKGFDTPGSMGSSRITNEETNETTYNTGQADRDMLMYHNRSRDWRTCSVQSPKYMTDLCYPESDELYQDPGPFPSYTGTIISGTWWVPKDKKFGTNAHQIPCCTSYHECFRQKMIPNPMKHIGGIPSSKKIQRKGMIKGKGKK